jgi:hypothetical protein
MCVVFDVGLTRSVKFDSRVLNGKLTAVCAPMRMIIFRPQVENCCKCADIPSVWKLTSELMLPRSDSITAVCLNEGQSSMYARATQERVMADEGQFGKFESDVRHLQADVTEIKGEVKSLRGFVDLLRTEFLSFKTEVAKEFGAVAKEFGSVRASIQELRTGMAKEFGRVDKEFGSVRTSIEELRTSMAKEFGLIRTEIERGKLWMLVTGGAMVLSVWGAALALARFLKP